MTSRHENCDQDKHADEDGLPWLRDGKSGQNPDHHGKDDHQQEEANQDVHTSQSNPEATSGGMECDHWIGMDYVDQPILQSRLDRAPIWVDARLSVKDAFNFCPWCGSRLLTEGPNSPTP